METIRTGSARNSKSKERGRTEGLDEAWSQSQVAIRQDARLWRSDALAVDSTQASSQTLPAERTNDSRLEEEQSLLIRRENVIGQA